MGQSTNVNYAVSTSAVHLRPALDKGGHLEVEEDYQICVRRSR